MISESFSSEYEFKAELDRLRAGTGALYAVEITKRDRDVLLDGAIAQSALRSLSVQEFEDQQYADIAALP